MARRDGTFPFAVAVSVRRREKPRAVILRPVIFRPLIGVAVQFHDLRQRQQMIGADRERIRVRVPVPHLRGKLRRRRDEAQCAPHAAQGIIRMVIFCGFHGKDPVEIAFLVIGRPTDFVQHFG